MNWSNISADSFTDQYELTSCSLARK